MAWEPDWNEENIGYPKPEEFENMTQEEFEEHCELLDLAPTQYEYARLDALSNNFNYISTVLEKIDMEGWPTVAVDRDLELGWLEWGKPLKMQRKDYETLYKSCTHWSNMCESPIECMLYDEVKKIDLNPEINLTLGDLLFKCKRDIAGRFTEGAGERYDQIYMIMDGNHLVPILIVECDGEANHTKVEDIKKDAMKEHNLCSHFPHVPVLRFTGTEIKSSGKKCASLIKSTFEFLCSIYPQLKANPDMVKQIRDNAVQRLVKII
ncbi:hypothetical protein BGM26_04560 [Bacillus sp. FJAT-29790]|uniref:hypothetical protein n=1 Tax=Bacillus sp. FJAT-29790 TaxID=1895002 RepID=UPI001C23B84A|nr:hypothetical protein [Bacillus sp. FJAT-29790]MBU8878259.1 hypothetical protein [Bacillus sp. FJAT-29790]